MQRRSGWLITTLALVSLGACSDDLPTAPRVSRSELHAALTPAAAARLNESGHFAFEDPIPVGGASWVTRVQARQLAWAFWRTFETDLRRYAAQDRGGSIAANLAICPRVYFVESGYGVFPVELVREYRRGYGASWIVGLCHGAEQQVAISVSVESTDIVVDAEGRVNGILPGDFALVGVVPGVTVPTEPEYGAVFSSSRAHRRVDGVPRLTRNGNRASPFTAIWTYDLESAVSLRGTTSGVERSRLVVGIGKWGSQTDTRMLDWNPDSAAVVREETFYFFVNGTPSTLVVTRRADVPASWEPVTVRTP